ncbi:MAG TPA: mechanosensitive ion channel family protein, partial [Pyrinomonadaceae bacterium]|nr:mechanosensitive ion channel family protein [Pyrinomonadaceae bacterium]
GNEIQSTLVQWLNDPTVQKIGIAIVAIGIVVAVSRLVKTSISRYVKSSDIRYRIRKFTTFASYVVAAFLLTLVFSDRLSGLTVAMGVAGAGIAFALQEVIASFAGWFAVTFVSFYNPGDRVELGGIKGDVIDISFLRTTLMEVGEWVDGDLYTGRVVRVANSFVFKAPVFNYSGDFPFLWDEIKIPVKYGGDHRLARKILGDVAEEVVGDYSRSAVKSWEELVKKYLLEDPGVGPVVTLVANDNWMEFTLRYVVDYKLRRTTKDLLFTRIIDEFDRSEGKVEFASATFHIVQTPTLKVDLQR